MSDTMHPLSIDGLLNWILDELKRDHIFGVHKDLFYDDSAGDKFRTNRYSLPLNTPLGVAAGPHTQLAPNIIKAWLLGARFIELKTVQTDDQLKITKPCIHVIDEGYNCEFSQELSLEQSFDEYLKAWMLIHILKHKLDFQNNELGTILNMSVGYDYSGIQQQNMQLYIKNMLNCSEQKSAYADQISAIYPAIKHIHIPDQITNNVTLSTMHGCPPDEIEHIARYLMIEKGLHATIKLNPTLLGAKRVRQLLKLRPGLDIHIPDEAFEHDLSFDDAVVLIRSLQECASANDRQFAVKLTNTLECVNKVLPDSEKRVYLSGCPLLPISVHLAFLLQQEFDGNLDVSFSGGADAFNFSDLVACGLSPVTVCTDLLKPGGYTRLPQYLSELSRHMKDSGSKTISDFILKKSAGSENVLTAAFQNLATFSRNVTGHSKIWQMGRGQSIKTERILTKFDCIHPPCVNTCAAHQDIPRYMYYTAQGDDSNALKVILETNPFPAVTGMVCDHLCQYKCTRVNYDNPLLIREIKRFITKQKTDIKLVPQSPCGLAAAIIGAGPSGLSCAFHLALHGLKIDVYEEKEHPGGMLKNAIPGFRLSDKALQQDLERIRQLGVNIYREKQVDKKLFATLKSEYDFIYIATGAKKGRKLGIKGEECRNVYDALEFLLKVSQGEQIDPGEHIAVIGGGNTALDAARTAFRQSPPNAEVDILYRRTRKEMPADLFEINQALGEGIQIKELVSPVEIKEEKNQLALCCHKTILGPMDESGRQKPVFVRNSAFWRRYDTIIVAIGQDIVLDFLDSQIDKNALDFQTVSPTIFIGGDALRGPSNIVTAIADGKKVADKIMAATDKHPKTSEKCHKYSDIVEFEKKSAQRVFGIKAPELAFDQRKNFTLVTQNLDENQARSEAARCLYCDDICNICVTVCPNSANMCYQIEPISYDLEKILINKGEYKLGKAGKFGVGQKYQIVTIADFCNECGNCETFCPTNGAPYRSKPKICLTENSYNDEKEAYRFLRINDKIAIKAKYDGKEESLRLRDGEYIYTTRHIRAVLHKDTFRVKECDVHTPHKEEITLQRAAEMSLLLRAFGDSYFRCC